jgi:hypothetical protein
MECDMKKLALSLVLLAFPLMVCADIIIFKDGMQVEVPEVWEKDGEVKCKVGGIVFGYPKDEVERIEKGQIDRKKEPAPIQAVPEKVTPIPKKDTASLKKKTAVSGKEAPAAQKEVSVPQKDKTVLKKAALAPQEKKAIPKKEEPAPKKEKAKKAVAPEHAKIPTFKVLINEDDNNPPAYIKRRRVLLVSRGLEKADIRAMLLSYEKKLRNELKAQSSEYKLIIVWAYDDFYKADEGAAGWVGKISNGQKTGKLSDNPELLVK